MQKDLYRRGQNQNPPTQPLIMQVPQSIIQAGFKQEILHQQGSLKPFGSTSSPEDSTDHIGDSNYHFVIGPDYLSAAASRSSVLGLITPDLESVSLPLALKNLLGCLGRVSVI